MTEEFITEVSKHINENPDAFEVDGTIDWMLRYDWYAIARQELKSKALGWGVISLEGNFQSAAWLELAIGGEYGDVLADVVPFVNEVQYRGKLEGLEYTFSTNPEKFFNDLSEAQSDLLYDLI